MARGFGTTLGAATTDRAVTTLTAHSVQRTFSIWTNRRSTGGGGLGRVFDKRVAGAETELFYVDVNYNFARIFSGGASRWTIPTSLVPADTWCHFAITYDSSSAANDPVICIDGVVHGVTAAARGSGTASVNSDAYVVGNRANDGARNWDGLLAEWAVWDRILSADDIAALAKGFSPAFFPASLVSHMPLVRDNVDELRAAPTLTGTAVQPHPSILYPETPQIVVPPAATTAVLFRRSLSARAGSRGAVRI